ECRKPQLLLAGSSGLKWGNPNISVSIMPDGTQLLGVPKSSMIREFDSEFGAIAWQEQLTRALNCWAQVTPIVFRRVLEALVNGVGVPQGSPGLAQNDPRFGDIRIGGFTSPGYGLGSTYYPYPNTTRG